MIVSSWLRPVFVCLLVLPLMTSCARKPPGDLENVCSIFKEKDGWYEAADDVYKKYGVPVHLQMAIIYQESHFRAEAKAPKDSLLGFIPWGRKSSAYGYAQVKDETWDWYIDKSGNWGADRDDFEDATDFIGWYATVTHQKLGISKWDAYNQYLAYHEGHGGFKRKTYNQKKWLISVARKVERNAARYRSQLGACRDDLESGFSLWPF